MRISSGALLRASCLVIPVVASPLRRGSPTVCPVTSSPSGYNVTNVISKGAAVASKSDEFGYHAEALLEYYNPELAVFYDYSFPDGNVPKPSGSEKSLVYAKPHITTGKSTLADPAGDTGNPAALGVSAVLLGQLDSTYMTAAQSQADYLLNNATRLYNGGISTLVESAEAWDEWIMNAPPFLAYYAAATNNGTLLNYTVNQISLYRDLLKSNGSEAVWVHIDSLGTDTDQATLSTGNGQVLMGIARVLAVVKNWGPSAGFGGTLDSLTSWAKEIADGVTNPNYRVGGLSSQVAQRPQDDQGLIWPHLSDTGNWFGETTGTALLAAALYRLAVLVPETFGSSYIQWAEVSRGAINGHTFSDGTLSPALDPYNSSSKIPYDSGSPLGQSSGIYLAAAYRDCVCAGICSS